MVLMALCLSPVLFAEVEEGKDYWKIESMQEVAPAEGDNLYFTWLGCLSCTLVEEKLESQLDGFERVPLIARPEWRPAAKVFYLLKLLNVDYSVWQGLMIEVQNNRVDATDFEQMKRYLIEQEVDKEALDRISENVDLFKKVNQAQALAKTYQVQYVPTVVIKGRYATDARHTKKVERMGEVISYLKEKP